jgi:3-deoxy-D-manno-octulosonic-acid transferase
MQRWLYSLLLRCALPLAAGSFLWRGWRHAAYRGSLRERLGYGLEPRADRPLWLHAASVGEVRALAPLLASLHADGVPLLVTAGTPTGLAMARELFRSMPRASGGEAALSVQAAPWDLPGAVTRFIAATRPRAGAFVETELWPNLVAAARRAGVPLALVSARLSARSLHRYRRWAPRLLRDTVQSFGAIGAQSEADARRFIELGAPVAAVTVIGNLKFDLPLAPDARARGAALRARWASARPLWVAGSTHPGEEEACLAAQRRLLERAQASGRAPPLLVLAPRRPERFESVAQALAQQGFTVTRSSQPAPDPVRADVLLVDQMGVLPDWYAACDAAFVGGSLVPVGGHNLLEPALPGKPVLAGPHQQNAPEVAAALAAAGGLHYVKDGEGIAAAVAALLEDRELARQQGERAAAAAAAQRGATARARSLLASLAPGSVTAPAAGPPSASG